MMHGRSVQLVTLKGYQWLRTVLPAELSCRCLSHILFTRVYVLVIHEPMSHICRNVSLDGCHYAHIEPSC